MIYIKQKGGFKKLDRYLRKSSRITKVQNIGSIAEECIKQLTVVTPKDTSNTALSWGYEIVTSRYETKLIIFNTNMVDGKSIAFLLDVGHATGTGYWIEGQHYIEPVVRDSYNKILNKTWKELERL